MECTTKVRSENASGALATAVSDTEAIAELELMLLLQPDEQEWFYTTPDVRHQRVDSREHARQLIRSVDDLEWATFDSADGNTFAQVGAEVGGVIVEVNSLPDWVQRVARLQPGGGRECTGRVGSIDGIPADELHKTAEAIELCLAWMDGRRIPEGYCLHNLARDDED
jgi:hypothetical protein